MNGRLRVVALFELAVVACIGAAVGGGIVLAAATYSADGFTTSRGFTLGNQVTSSTTTQINRIVYDSSGGNEPSIRSDDAEASLWLRGQDEATAAKSTIKMGTTNGIQITKMQYPVSLSATTHQSVPISTLCLRYLDVDGDLISVSVRPTHLPFWTDLCEDGSMAVRRRMMS